MTATHMSHRMLFVFAAWLVLQAASAAQDTLARAKDLYQSAAYDEALAVLDRLRPESGGVAATEVAQYRVFCLLALDRSDEARKAIEAIVVADPFYRPSESQTSPRIRSIFQDIRRAMLPTIVQRSYSEAKAAFDRKDPQAAAEFERVMTLLDDPDLRGGAFTDLRTVASGFRDLSKAMASAIPAAGASSNQSGEGTAGQRDASGTAPSQAVPPPIARPEPPPTAHEGDTGVVPPVAVQMTMPRWMPSTVFDRRQDFKGTLEIAIDEQGNVTSARIQKRIHPVYDPMLLKAALDWKFKPATKNGAPTMYLKVIEVALGRVD